MTGATIGPPPPRRHHVLGVVLLPVALQAAIVWMFGTRMLLWDEFVYVSAFREIGEGKPWLHWIWQQHNEHRIVWTKLLFFAHAGASGWNLLIDMYVSALLTGLNAWGIWKLYRATGSAKPAYFLPVALLLCSLAQYMTILYGLMTCHYFTLAGMIWAIVFLMRGTWMGLAAAIACAFAALASTLSALVIMPIGLFVLLATRQKPAQCVTWIAAMLLGAFTYFYSYQSPGITPVNWGSPAAIWQATVTFLVCLGSPLSAGSVSWASPLGVATLVVFAMLGLGLRAEGTRGHAGLVALGLIGIGSAAAVAAGRSALGPAVGLESKYVAYSTLALVAPYLGLASFSRLPAIREIQAGLTIVVIVGLMAANIAGYDQARTWKRARNQEAYLLQTIDIQPDQSLGSIFSVPQVRDHAAYLRATRLGPFHETVDVLVPPRWQEGRPTAPISTAAPLQAHLVCPVDTLVDLGLVVSPAGGAGSVEVSVTAEGRVVGRGRLVAGGVPPAPYVRVTLDTPLRGCRGTDLIVEVTSGAGDAAAAFHSWTYPVYFAGVTRQGGNLIDLRSLGVVFNAFSYGLID
jgi:hypothetical protein